LDLKVGTTYRFTFTSALDGVPSALGGSPVVSVYKDGSNSQTTTGVTLTASFDGIAGLNLVEIDTSSDGTFYSAGSNFCAVITTGTVNGVSVAGSVVDLFSIEKAPVNWAQVTAPTTTNALTGTSVNLIAGQLFFKKNVAYSNFAFLMTDSTNHLPAAGLTVTATRKIDNGAFAACANAVTEVANGWYTINFANTDLNGTNVAFNFSAPGADLLAFSIVTQT